MPPWNEPSSVGYDWLRERDYERRQWDADQAAEAKRRREAYADTAEGKRAQRLHEAQEWQRQREEIVHQEAEKAEQEAKRQAEDRLIAEHEEFKRRTSGS